MYRKAGSRKYIGKMPLSRSFGVPTNSAVGPHWCHSNPEL